MSSFLIDRNSPIRSVNDIPRTRLHHRSRHSESDPGDSPLRSIPQQPQQPQHSQQQQKNEQEKNSQHSSPGKTESMKGPSMFSYFRSELTRSYKLEENASEFVERRDRIYVSVNTPKSLEKFCAFGLLQCLDSILNIMTFLPLRLLGCLIHVLTYPCSVLFFKKRAILNPAQICDILKGVVLVVSCFITSYIDTSMVYHIVRTQSTIKFYVIYNMLDVMDKLISGFGQDVLDSLYWTAVEPRGRKREHFGTIFHLIFAIAYVVIHTALILIQAITLNVAFNSHNKNLLTIILSNNFVEIKGNLFKRLDKNTLCQITYFDVKERFHYFVLLLFILIHNLLEKNWLRDQAYIYLMDALIVIVAEVIVDWIKHSFINKINEFSPSYYNDFAIGLAQDIASSQKKHAFTDFSDQVCRRMGFTPIPLICLLYMVSRKSFEISGIMSWMIVFMFYLCLFTTKVINSIVLLGWAQHLITQGEKVAESNVTVGNSQVMPKKDDKKSDKKRVKTESISHCPDITSHPVHTQQYPISEHDAKPPFQSPTTSFGDYPPSKTYQTGTTTPLSATNAATEITIKSEPVILTTNDDRFGNDNLNDTPVKHVVPVHQNEKSNGDVDQSQSDIFRDEEVGLTKDEELCDKQETVEDLKNDLYHIILQDSPDTSSFPSSVDDSRMSVYSTPTVVSSSTSEESKQEEPSPMQTVENINEPFMLKLVSNSPLPSHQKIRNVSPSCSPSHSNLSLKSPTASDNSPSVPTKCVEKSSEVLSDVSSESHLSKLVDTEGDRDSFLEHITDLNQET